MSPKRAAVFFAALAFVVSLSTAARADVPQQAIGSLFAETKCLSDGFTNLAAISKHERECLKESLGLGLQGALLSLSTETDEGTFCDQLTGLAFSIDTTKLEHATRILRTVIRFCPEEFQEKASARLLVYAGEGPLGARTEYQTSRIPRFLPWIGLAFLIGAMLRWLLRGR